MGLNVDEYRNCADKPNRLGGSDKRERAGDYLVSGLNAAGQQCEVQGIGAIGAADRMIHAEILSGFLVEGLHVGTQDKAGLTQRLQNGAVDFRFQGFVLTLQVDHGYCHNDSLICVVMAIAVSSARLPSSPFTSGRLPVLIASIKSRTSRLSASLSSN